MNDTPTPADAPAAPLERIAAAMERQNELLAQVVTMLAEHNGRYGFLIEVVS